MKILFVILFLCCNAVYAFGKGTKEISVDENTTLIDVRTVAEYNAGHLDTAINIPHTEIKEKIAGIVTDKERTIIVYCRSGRRSGIALSVLKKMGYKNVTNAGAYKSLKVKKIGAKSDE